MSVSANSATLAAVVAIAFAFGFGFNTDAVPSREPLAVLTALRRTAIANPGATAQNATFVLGSNVCVDLIVPAFSVLPDVAGVQGGDRDFLRTNDDVSAVFAHFHSQGAAAERSCAPDVFEPLVTAAGAINSARRSLGGNAALMARRLARIVPGGSVILAGHVGPAARALLPSSVKLAQPLSDNDEVHLILEYARGEAGAPRANRFIVTADTGNTDVAPMLAAIRAAADSAADVLIVAGLHMLEPLPEDRRTQALGAIAAALTALPPATRVHVELASMADAGFTRAVATAILGSAATSIGFNEQEAAFLYEALGGRYAVPDVDDGSPSSRVAVAGSAPELGAVASVIRFLFEYFPRGRLSRIHFHALHFHIIAYTTEAVTSGVWRGRRAAVAASAVAATTEACGAASIDDVSPADVALPSASTMRVADPRPATASAGYVSLPVVRGDFAIDASSSTLLWRWSSTAGQLSFSLAPVVVCHAPASTVGLGDAISATGLAVDVPVPAKGSDIKGDLRASVAALLVGFQRTGERASDAVARILARLR